MVFNVNDNGEIEDFEVDWLGKKVYVSMEEAEIYEKVVFDDLTNIYKKS